MKLTRNALKEMIREILDEVSAASAAGGKAKSAGKRSGGKNAKRGSAGKVDPGGNTVMRKRSHKRRRKIRKPVHGLR